MLDFGFSEILLTSAIALVVLGPERLPKVARQVGNWMGRARMMARQLSEQLEREVSAEELLKDSMKPKASTANRLAAPTYDAPRYTAPLPAPQFVSPDPHTPLSEPHASPSDLHAVLPAAYTALSEPHASRSNPHAVLPDPHTPLSDPHTLLPEPHASRSDMHTPLSEPHAEYEPSPAAVRSPAGTDAADLGTRGGGAAQGEQTPPTQHASLATTEHAAGSGHPPPTP